MQLKPLMFVISVLFFPIGLQSVKAQTYPSVRDVTQFTQSANYMSLPGYLRWRYYLDTGRWISREESIHDGPSQLGFVPPAPTSDEE